MLPNGIVTFLFTDIQDSTPLWEEMPGEMKTAVAQHHAILRKAIESNGGVVSQVIGDSFESAFRLASQGLAAAIEAQRSLQEVEWGPTGALKVRMGLHTGPAELDLTGNAPYQVSHTLNRSARVMSAGHGGQILLSQETFDLVRRELPEGVTLKDLGEHRLKGMQQLEHIYQVVAPGLQHEFPPLNTFAEHPHNLPPQMTSFIGREKEIADVLELLKKQRLVTLTGSGGVGKTRLLLRVTEEIVELFPDGVWYIELAPISNPELVSQFIAATIGLREDPHHPTIDVLTGYLGNREALLILDNCEHLLETSARLTDTLLRFSPRLKVFISSREALGIAGESTFRVPSMSIPDPNHIPPLADFEAYESVQLFTERVRAVLPSFHLDEHNAPAIAQICQRLDGIPLALELAAARINMLTTEQLASRLDNAFRLLTGGSRTALPRQQTLQATIDWSYQLLNEKERRLLRRMAVFAGGCNLDSAEAVCLGDGVEKGEIFDLLASLVNKSMVVVEREQHEETRYRLLETVRQYARMKLYEAGESTLFHDHFLNYFLEMAEAIEPQMRTATALERLEELNREFDNFRGALSWALDGENNPNIEAGLRLAIALLELWHTQNFHNEGYAWLSKGLARSSEKEAVKDDIRAKTYFAAGHLILPIGRYEESRQCFLKSLDIFQGTGDVRGRVMAQSMLGESYACLRQFKEAIKLCELSIPTCRSLDDPWLLAWALCRLGLCHMFHKDPDQAQNYLEESLSIFEKLNDKLQTGDVYIMLGMIAFDRGEYSKSEIYQRKCLAFAQARKSNWTVINALYNLGKLCYMKGDFMQMKTYLEESVAISREIGPQFLISDLLLLGVAELHLAQSRQAAAHFKECLESSRESRIIANSLTGMAGVALQTERVYEAAQLLGAVKRLLEGKVTGLEIIHQKEFDRTWLEVSTRFGETGFDTAVSEGGSMSLEQAVDYAIQCLSS